MTEKKKDFCQAYRLFRKGKFYFCIHCIYFFKTGSRCICTGDVKEKNYNIKREEMIFSPITRKGIEFPETEVKACKPKKCH